MKLDEIRELLTRFIADEMPDAELGEVTASDGHAGLTFLFDVIVSNDANRKRYVIKVPPRGVKLRGNTDVYRQAPLLRALHAQGHPVPAVPWAYTDNPWFDLPFIIMERLPGRVYFVWEPHESFSREPSFSRHLWQQCLDLLPQLHEFDWRSNLGDWESAQGVDRLVTQWERIYRQAPESAWAIAGERAQQALSRSMPDPNPIGLFHGDYQPGNVLYDGDRLTGVVDWELAGIGPQMLDVGWMMLVGDENNWRNVPHPPVHPLAPDEIRDAYESARGRSYPSIPWFQAYAGYRLGAIACLNIKMHRKGQRHEPFWEHLAGAVEPMFERAVEILS